MNVRGVKLSCVAIWLANAVRDNTDSEKAISAVRDNIDIEKATRGTNSSLKEARLETSPPITSLPAFAETQRYYVSFFDGDGYNASLSGVALDEPFRRDFVFRQVEEMKLNMFYDEYRVQTMHFKDINLDPVFAMNSAAAHDFRQQMKWADQPWTEGLINVFKQVESAVENNAANFLPFLEGKLENGELEAVVLDVNARYVDRITQAVMLHKDDKVHGPYYKEQFRQVYEEMVGLEEHGVFAKTFPKWHRAVKVLPSIPKPTVTVKAAFNVWIQWSEYSAISPLVFAADSDENPAVNLIDSLVPENPAVYPVFPPPENPADYPVDLASIPNMKKRDAFMFPTWDLPEQPGSMYDGGFPAAFHAGAASIWMPAYKAVFAKDGALMSTVYGDVVPAATVESIIESLPDTNGKPPPRMSVEFRVGVLY